MSNNSASQNLDNLSIGDFLNLLRIHFKTLFANALELFKIVPRYYKNFVFFKSEILLFTAYFFKNPYRISKAFLKKQKAPNLYTYGETYLTTIDQIARNCQILSHDHVLELGCGRGRSLFWLHTHVHCMVTGVDYIPEFINKALRIKKMLHLHKMTFIEKDLLVLNFNEASVIYFYGTSFSDDMIKEVIEKMKNLKKGTKVISVSFPLSDYCEATLFETVKQFEAKYPWGIADIYLQIKL